MREQDYDEFAALLGDVWALKGQALTGGQKAIFFRALAAHPINEVRAGLDAHIRDPKRGQFLPMPADVIAQIEGIVADDGRPGAEEAWATVVRAADEAATIVWTAETAEAFGVARPLLLSGDDIGARMAFKESYARLVSEARNQRVPTKWSATLGHDDEGRNAALLPHVHAGRVSADLLLARPATLDALRLPAPAAETDSIRAARASAREALLRIRAEAGSSDRLQTPSQIDAARTVALKAEAAKKAADYIAAHAAK
jgi:hypothetical protein